MLDASGLCRTVSRGFENHTSGNNEEGGFCVGKKVLDKSLEERPYHRGTLVQSKILALCTSESIHSTSELVPVEQKLSAHEDLREHL